MVITMTCEEYYGAENYTKMKEALDQLIELTDNWKTESIDSADVQPIVYCCHRIKKPENMIRKLQTRGLPTSPDVALQRMYDGVGFRIICSFESDVHFIIGKLETCKLFTVIKKKDYLSYPKPNGYRSIHLCVQMNDSGVLAEIQVRTIAMDFWATLEHQLKYKKDVANEALMKSELKRCADEIASVDLTMQTMREILKESL